MSKYKIWYVHQVPGPVFEREVPNPEIGAGVLEAIYAVALYQFENAMIPDYANAGGIAQLDDDGVWVDYHPEEG